MAHYLWKTMTAPELLLAWHGQTTAVAEAGAATLCGWCQGLLSSCDCAQCMADLYLHLVLDSGNPAA